jgi:hypothetical protein
MMKNGTVADFRAYAARQMNNLHRGNRGLYRFFIILLGQHLGNWVVPKFSPM